ncbi:hypothetical protein ACMXY6_07265 [Pasteurella multocida]|uniref:hypothetical protein n=1 Tax=Pasteurella multocida TaxID=747 RepID=UPI003CEADE28
MHCVLRWRNFSKNKPFIQVAYMGLWFEHYSRCHSNDFCLVIVTFFRECCPKGKENFSQVTLAKHAVRSLLTWR